VAIGLLLGDRSFAAAASTEEPHGEVLPLPEEKSETGATVQPRR
jgi:hypothetical protein